MIEEQMESGCSTAGLGDDSWFARNQRDKTKFRSAERCEALAIKLGEHGFRYLFPHVCPSHPDGIISPIDPDQTRLFLDHVEGFSVVPWVGGVLDLHCFPDSVEWRENFVNSICTMLEEHPRLAGVQLNIEPMPSGNAYFLLLLDELKAAMPVGKILSVAAYPPPTVLHPFPEVHWEEDYYREVARRVDQTAPMMYDTAVKVPKVYQQLMATWTREVLDWSEGSEVLLGLPAYATEGVQYHFSYVENLKNAFPGIHAGLRSYENVPAAYAGVAIYSEWEMDDEEWALFEREFGRVR